MQQLCENNVYRKFSERMSCFRENNVYKKILWEWNKPVKGKFLYFPHVASGQNFLKEYYAQKMCMHTWIDSRQIFFSKANLLQKILYKNIVYRKLSVRMQNFGENNVYSKFSSRISCFRENNVYSKFSVRMK